METRIKTFTNPAATRCARVYQGDLGYRVEFYKMVGSLIAHMDLLDVHTLDRNEAFAKALKWVKP